jgi:hypothetical protein
MSKAAGLDRQSQTVSSAQLIPKAEREMMRRGIAIGHINDMGHLNSFDRSIPASSQVIQ